MFYFWILLKWMVWSNTLSTEWFWSDTWCIGWLGRLLCKMDGDLLDLGLDGESVMSLTTPWTGLFGYLVGFLLNWMATMVAWQNQVVRCFVVVFVVVVVVGGGGGGGGGVCVCVCVCVSV